ncbi:Eco57I restriction-modification methylase domain-containing protein [Erysipelothrix rhusiopathiae]|uniref:Eco57I restriction-modification methylase domain-containing protein n=1 Tax=Erysipelothrix rhusiopathiae TaxID=1648 RepID=UPI00202B6AAB|nr:Eco57I restriction-modification methylase domain-containing protein [Erysipelothrix rhusiopathiae]URQ76881.1 Eco57I restriction-modification methylase domain-containing protein [Erysipelothrix rhusiopathiae]
MSVIFSNSLEYKIIYIIELKTESHKGLLKIGDTSIESNLSIEELKTNSSILNHAARERIKAYTNTAGLDYNLLHTELAVRKINTSSNQTVLEAFRDHDVHRVLNNSGISKKKIKGTTSREWYEVDLDTARKAINAVKEGKKNLSNVKIDKYTSIIFRPEQNRAISETIKKFNKSDRMLWNAKMRFGKTLCAFEVVKKLKFKKTIIITHRPVVDSGWYEDFNKIFYDDQTYIYGSKNKGYEFDEIISSEKNIVYFASMQDLRESAFLGGKYEKNNKIFETVWDLIIVDEAHEGTTTTLGNDVIKAIFKENLGLTKLLALSGTPFNILGNYEDSVYTWDYIMEQKAKKEWDVLNFGDSNPYDELPEMRMYTYNLGFAFENKKFLDIEDKAFNFREFFRVWTGDVSKDLKKISSDDDIGKFINEEDVKKFLNLLTSQSEDSDYPYSKQEYRDIFKHSLWMVPGVKEAKALSGLLKQHPVFGSDFFEIVNVAGEGDEEEKYKDAEEKVKNAILNAGTDNYTITLSCGKLTTGVTIPEWTAVLYLTGSVYTSAANYLQTIFRVQSPCNVNGQIKKLCYVFDFAPDRTLKMISDSVSISAKAGKTSGQDREILNEFLNYCPVISIEGSKMVEYDSGSMLQQLKRAYAERAVRNGFDDNHIYNDKLLKLDDIEIKEFRKLHGIIGSSKPSRNIEIIDINNQGLSEEEYKKAEEARKKKPRERTREEIEMLETLNEKRKQANNARSVLRSISIRIPLLIYGADVDINEDVTMSDLVDLVDDSSWVEFMPDKITKKIFLQFSKYYDQDVFVAAGRKIRSIAMDADTLPPKDRIIKISNLFATFKNPDKETVLTPWKVVNIHMGDTLGGYNFYDKVSKETLSDAKFINNGEITSRVFSDSSSLLEINSKSGLYALYLAYSIFEIRLKKIPEDQQTLLLQKKIWREVLENNIFIVCKTPMAKSIVNRTLKGYENIRINARYFDDLNNTIKFKSKQFTDRIVRENYWKNEGSKCIMFDAIVGNPPYQESDKEDGKGSASPIYNLFIDAARMINPKYISLITPSVWFLGGKGMAGFRKTMLDDARFKEFNNYLTPKDLFSNVNLRGGVNYFVWDRDYNNTKDGIVVREILNEKLITEDKRDYKIENLNLFISDNIGFNIITRFYENNILDIDFLGSNKTLANYVSERNPFGISTTFQKFDKENNDIEQSRVYLSRGKIAHINNDRIKKGKEHIDTIKVITPFANNIATDLADDNFNTTIIGKNEIVSETFLVIGSGLLQNRIEANNLSNYLKTKFVRFLYYLAKANQNGTRQTYRFIPIQDFGSESDIDWEADYEEQLYRKYSITREERMYIENRIKDME